MLSKSELCIKPSVCLTTPSLLFSKEEKQNPQLMSLNHPPLPHKPLDSVHPPTLCHGGLLTLSRCAAFCLVMTQSYWSKTLRVRGLAGIWFFNTTWYLINCRTGFNGNIIIQWQNDWALTLSRCLWEASLNTQLPCGLANGKSYSGLGFLVSISLFT